MKSNKAKPLPDRLYLMEIFDYDPLTGKLSWKDPNRYVKEVGSKARKNNAYKQVIVDGKLYLAHRLIWLMVTGDEPQGFIDHVNRVRSDNRFVNLRQCTRSENCMNTSRRSCNKSGFVGVFWLSRYKKWKAYITANGKQNYLGVFSNLEDAIEARRLGELKFHGDFSTNNTKT